MDHVDFHGYHYDDDDDLDDGQWAMDIIDAILERAFWQPPKFSSLDQYLKHQYVLLETEIDEAGNPPASTTEADFPPNPNPPHTFNLIDGTITASKTKPLKGWSLWDTTLVRERQLYMMTDSMIKRLNDQYRLQGRRMPVFRDERFPCKNEFIANIKRNSLHPVFVRDDVSKQEMNMNYNVEIQSTDCPCKNYRGYNRSKINPSLHF
ncbi:hypothetical protein M758_1G114400 [Ceratodon purpureus]|nr:hypothetical protein M758_1G114400 [Ceratodon purpureus]